MIEGLKPYAGYKNPGLPWLDAIPSHWEMIPNRALMKDQRQVVGERASDYTLLSLTLQGVIVRDMVNPKGKFPAQFNTYKIVRPNDLIFCLFDIDETPRGVGLSHHRGMITGAYDVFSPTMHVDPRFLNHYYRFIDDGKLMKPLYTGLRKTIQRGTFAGLKTPCPPHDEQAAIVRFLDHANRKIDGFIRAKRKLIGLLNEQKQAIIHRAVTRGLKCDVPLKPCGIPWLGDIPKHWEVSSVKRLRRKGTKTFTDGDWIELPFITESGVRLIQTGNVGKGCYREKGFRYISDHTFSSFGCTEVSPGDVLICRLDGPVGRACMAPDLGVKMITSVDNTILKPRADIEPRFIVLIMTSSPWLSWIESMCRAGGGFRYRVSRSMLGSLSVPTPPFSEQKEIVRHVEDEHRPLNETIARTEREIGLMQEYRTRLTADVVTGKLDVRSAAAKLPDFTPPTPDPAADNSQEETDDEATET